MREHVANSQEIARPFDTMEFPRVAHMVADLDDEAGGPADVRPSYAASSEASIARAWSLCRPFADVWASELMAGAGAGHTLVITLEVGQYLTRQSGWRGRWRCGSWWRD